MLRTIILITRGILLDPRSRRWAMFILLMVALVMLFLGSTFMSAEIATPVAFLVYWGICGWLTFTGRRGTPTRRPLPRKSKFLRHSWKVKENILRPRS